ncbi:MULTISPECIES: hypothetical protein [Acidiphilium]|uniref:hypothetical protein n=1 Tax=Acidiphilium TaxID=522 RepID=UPI00257B1EC9|nr:MULTISPECIES: hypothetical protein [Acidiphilium]HQT84376.1 hypothetical protein [Acidiphilium rubrum]
MRGKPIVMQGDPRLIIHCGFHKTGSTALQATLRSSETRLRAAGFLYPYAGSRDRPGRISSDPSSSAHHNLAWHMVRHQLCNPAHGDPPALLAEIAGFAGDVILSSEEFETLLTGADGPAILHGLAGQAGRKLVLVIYLRNQIAYAETLFLELIKHGIGTDYERHADEILQTGHRRFEEAVHCFDYQRALAPLRASTDARIILRNYHDLGPGGIVADFAGLFGLTDALRPSPGRETANHRQSTATALYTFHRNRTGQRPSPIERNRIMRIAASTDQSTSSADLQHRFARRFGPGNRALCTEWQLPTTGLDAARMIRPASELPLESLFSFETQCAITTPETADLPAWLAAIGLENTTIPLSARILDRLQQAHRYRRRVADRVINKIFNEPGSAPAPAPSSPR